MRGRMRKRSKILLYFTLEHTEIWPYSFSVALGGRGYTAEVKDFTLCKEKSEQKIFRNLELRQSL
jgi:hypothetical protein